MSYPPPPDQPNQGGYQYDPYGGQGGSQPPSPQQPGYGTPQQPGYGTPQQPGYESQPQYGAAPQMPPAAPGYAPQYAAMPAQQPKNGMGNASLVLGILGLVTGWIPVIGWFAFIESILAIIFGAVGLSKVKKGEATNKGVAIAGLVLGVAAFALAIIAVIVVASMLGTAASTSTY